MSNSNKISYLRLFLFFLPRNKFTSILPYIVDHSFIRLIRGKTCLHKSILYIFLVYAFTSLAVLYIVHVLVKEQVLLCVMRSHTKFMDKFTRRFLYFFFCSSFLYTDTTTITSQKCHFLFYSSFA